MVRMSYIFDSVEATEHFLEKVQKIGSPFRRGRIDRRDKLIVNIELSLPVLERDLSKISNIADEFGGGFMAIAGNY